MTYANWPRRAEQCRAKLALCIRTARGDSRNYVETGDRRFLGLRVEAMQDARYWRDALEEAVGNMKRGEGAE